MILECPSCHNRYLVDPRAVGKAGRTVRCAKCRHEWFATPPEEAPADEALPVEEVAEARPEPRPIPEGSSVPVVHTPRMGVPQGIQLATVAALVMFLITAALYFRPLIVEAVPGLKGSYAALGIYDTDGVVFANLEYAQTKDISKDSHSISGYLVNTATEPRRFPVVSIALLNEDRQLLRRVRITDEGTLPPGGQQKFSRALMASPESTRNIVIELGSPFELKLR